MYPAKIGRLRGWKKHLVAYYVKKLEKAGLARCIQLAPQFVRKGYQIDLQKLDRRNAMLSLMENNRHNNESCCCQED